MKGNDRMFKERKNIMRKGSEVGSHAHYEGRSDE